MDLLARLKSIKVSSKQVVVPKIPLPTPRSDGFGATKLESILKLHLGDPLTWNAYVLARIYKISEKECENLVKHVHPMYSYIDSTLQKPKPLFKMSLVYDLKRYKMDKNYMRDLKKLKFPDSNTKLGYFAPVDVDVIRIKEDFEDK